MAKNNKTNFVEFKNKKKPLRVRSRFSREWPVLKKEIENLLTNKGRLN